MRFLKNLGQASILAMMMSGAVSAQTIEGTVTVNDNGGLGQGPVTMAEGATIVAGADNLVLENDIAINGRGNIDTDGNTTTLAGILSDGGVDGFSLAGQLRKFGAGTLVLQAANTYSGGTRLHEGALAVANNRALGSGALTIGTGTTLLAGADGLVLQNDIVINGSGNIDTGANTITLAGVISDGVISEFGFVGQWQVNEGPGWSENPRAFTGQEAAALLFGGNANDYQISTIGTDIDDINRKAWVSVYGAAGFPDCEGFPCGRQVDDNFVKSTDGFYANEGDESAFVSDWAQGAAFTNYAFGMVDVRVASQLRKLGAGTLILQAANTYTGGTLLNEGTLVVANNRALGTGVLTMGNDTTLVAGANGLVLQNDVVINGRGNIDTGANTLTLAGVISDGVITELSFAGQWQVDEGPNWTDAPRAYTGQEAAALLFGGNPADYQISTAGTDIEAINRKAWVSTYGLSGGAQVADDFVTSTGGFYRNFADQSAFVRDNAIGSEFTNYAFGLVDVPTAAQLYKRGSGTLILEGANSYTGGTFVQQGELRVIGSIRNSQVTVLSGATLSGNGVIGSLVANLGSTIAPGVNGAGTLRVDGAINLQAGSTVQWQVRAGGPSDLIVGGGAAQLGGTAAFTNLGGTYAFNSTILLMQADGGRTGSFASTNGLAGFGIIYRPELVYTNTQVLLRMAPNLLSNIVGNTPLTENQRAVVNRIDGAVTAGYNPQPLFNVYALPNAQLPGAFDQLSGEIYATAAGVGMEQERLVREAVLGRLVSVARAARSAPEAGAATGPWAQLFGGWGNGDSDGNASRFEADRMGFATGIDFGSANENGGWRAGVFGLSLQSDVTIDRLGSSAQVEQAGLGVYGSVSSGSFDIALGGYVTDVQIEASRFINLPNFADGTIGRADGNGQQAFAELSYNLETDNAVIRPFLGAAIGSLEIDGMIESGGAAALNMRRQSYTTGSMTAGADGSVKVGKKLRLGGTLAGRLQLGDRDPQAQLALAAAPQQAFTVRGVQLDQAALVAGFDATWELDSNVQFSVGYNGLIGSTITDNVARASLQMRF